MTDQVCRIVYYIIYAVELFWVGEAIFHDAVREKHRYVGMAVVYVAVIIPTVLFAGNYFLIELGLNIAIYICLFRGKITLRLARFLRVYIFSSAIESVVSGIGYVLLRIPLKSIHVSALRSEIVRLLFAVVSIAFTVFMVRKKWVQKLIKYLHELKWYQYIAVILMITTGILLLVICEVLLEYIGNNSEIETILFITVIVLLGTTFAAFFWLASSIYSRNHYLKQNQIKEEIINAQQKYYQGIYENDRELRKFRHDIRSQLGCLQLLLTEGKTNQAVAYLESIGNHLEKLTLQKFYTGSEILDAVMQQKYLEAKKKGVSINVEGKMTKPDFIDVYELCILFSNALDNGIEACEKLQDREKVIMVSLVEHRKVIFFQIANPATQEMYEVLKQGVTSKKNSQKHGFGVKSIQDIVQRNRGELEYIWKDGILALEICFEI
ncbi:MAG: GHKL domain-containing protein [Lachnospiraceae bacterium]|nr:GHKL domain-containing protein [Lachnospiraceae bacterium]